MKMSEYVREYTSGERITLRNVFSELRELVVEVLRMCKSGIREEFEDVLHFVQLWLYWRCGLDGELWKITNNSVAKFMRRKPVWKRIYAFVGLDKNISGYVGNYKKEEKVVKHLHKFGISHEHAIEAHKEIVLKEHE